MKWLGYNGFIGRSPDTATAEDLNALGPAPPLPQEESGRTVMRARGAGSADGRSGRLEAVGNWVWVRPDRPVSLLAARDLGHSDVPHAPSLGSSFGASPSPNSLRVKKKADHGFTLFFAGETVRISPLVRTDRRCSSSKSAEGEVRCEQARTTPVFCDEGHGARVTATGMSTLLFVRVMPRFRLRSCSPSRFNASRYFA